MSTQSFRMVDEGGRLLLDYALSDINGLPVDSFSGFFSRKKGQQEKDQLAYIN